MTLHRWESDIETHKGTGQVRSKGEIIGSASYDLRVETEGITAKSFLDDKTRFTRRTVTGQISLLAGATLPVNNPGSPQGPFVLVLEDGREVDFYTESCVTGSDLQGQVFTIQGSGNRL